MDDRAVVVVLSSGEQVWGRPVGTDLVQLASMPAPDAEGHRWGDIVRTYTAADGTVVEQEIVEHSPYATVVAVVSAMPAHVDALFRSCAQRGWGFLNWTELTGRSRPDAPQRLGIAGPPDEVYALLDEWERWRRDRKVLSVDVVP